METIPGQGQVEADIAALEKVSKTLDRIHADQNIDVEEVMADFEAARRPTGIRKKSPA
jgi:hypothetical protein